MVSGNQLRILQRNHFVPQYDTWLRDFAESWGERNGIEVDLVLVPDSDLLPTADQAFADGEGFDLIEFISPPSAREPDVRSLNDLNAEAVSRFGDPIELCRQSSFNPRTDNYYGFCVGWTPLPNLYRRSLWDSIGMPNGPTTWEEVRDGGRMIREASGEVVAIGMSQELDSSQSLRAILWSHGASLQDSNNELALDSMETRAALTYAKELFEQAMDANIENVFEWTASSNNQALISGNASLINNPISAYRTPLRSGEAIADDIFLTPALPSAMAAGRTPPCCLSVYTIPTFSRVPEQAEMFLLELASNYAEAVSNAALYNLPAFPSTVPMVSEWLQDDPQGSMPADKLAVLADAGNWTVNLGWPGSANPAVGEVWDSHILPTMFAAVASGEKTPDDAIVDALAEIQPIFARWRETGLL
jgi:multiple sugar transport system substrate-binding protein